MRLTKIALLCSLFLIFQIQAHAQQNKQTLREALIIVEKNHQVSFTFLDEDVDGLWIEIIPAHLSLDDIITFLREQTDLVFTRLDQRFITVSKPTEGTKHICGVLVDGETNEKIEGAYIQIGAKTLLSNHLGYFEYSGLSGDSLISIKSLGYEELIVEAEVLASSPCKTISLQLKTSRLSEVIISNYLTTGIDKVVDGSLTIRSKELGILPGLTEPDVLFTVQSLPGIQSVDETVSNINVRGGTHDQNLVLWDGMKMYQQGHFFGLISAFNPYLTKEVNVIKNGTSTMFSDAASSTFDIRSDDEVNHTLSGSAGLNMINGDALIKIPLFKRAALHLSGRRSIADLIETPTYTSYFNRAFRGTDVTSGDINMNDTISTDEGFKFYDVSAKFLYDITGNDKLRINFLKIYNNIDFKENETINKVTESKTSGLTQENMVGGISYAHLWSQRAKTSAQAYLSHYNLESVNFDIPNNQRLIQQNEVLDMGIKIDTRAQLSDRVDFFGGYQFFEVGVTNLEDINNPVYYRLIKKVLRTHVAFAEMNYTSPSGNTSIRAGVRGNYFSKFKEFRAEPRLSFNQKLNEFLSFELLGELKSQTTVQVIDFQNDFLGVEKRRWVLANGEDIPIVKSQQASAGLNFHNHNLLLVLEGFTKQVDGIITSSQGFQNQFQYVRSIGKYTANGLEFLAKGNISNANSWVSYSLTVNRYTFNELVPPGFPSNLDIRHRITWGASYQTNHWDFSCGLNWHSGRPYTQPSEPPLISGAINFQSPNSSRLPDYWRVDLSARYKFDLSPRLRATAGVSIWNVLDHNNVIDAYYQLNTQGQIDSYQRSALGFTPNAMFRIEF